MTAPDPRLEEIEGLSEFLSCIDSERIGDYGRAADALTYLLAELRKAQDKLARVEGLAADWDVVYETFPQTAGGVLAKAHGNQLRAAVADATGGGE